MNRKIWTIGLALMLLPFALAFGFSEVERSTVQTVVNSAVADLAASSVSRTDALLVLPIRGDQEAYAENLLKSALLSAGFNVVEPPDGPVWNRILAEIEWAERKEDLLDAKTVVKFGDIEGAKMLIYGRLVDVSRTPERVFAELLLHATSIATRQQIWGGAFAKSEYLAKDYAGVVSLDAHVRAVLNAIMEKMAESIRQSAKLPSGTTVALVPLAGDQDGFVSGMVRDVVAATDLKPLEIHVRTVAQAREKTAAQTSSAQAILSGAVRDLYSIQRNDVTQEAVEIGAAVQVAIQDRETGEILWSGTFDDAQVFSEPIPWWNLLLRVETRVWLYVVGGLLALVLVSRFLRATQRVR